MKKQISFILILALLLGLLAGCGSTETTSVTSDADTTVADVSITSEEAAETAPAEEVTEEAASEASVEESVEESIVYEKMDYTLPIFEAGETVSMWYIRRDTSGINPPYKDDPEYNFWGTLQEQLGIDIEFNEPSEGVAETQYNLMIASGDMTDIICEYILADEASAYVGGYDKAIEDDVYIDLMPYLDYAPNYAYYVMGDDAVRKTVLTDEGHLAGFFAVKTEPELASMGLCVNSALMEETGLEMPDTVSEWLTVFEAMANNGVTYPCDVSADGAIMNGAFADAIGACIDCEFLVDAESGDLVFGPTTDETREYLEIFVECFNKGWIDPDWTIDQGFLNAYFVSQQIPTTSAMAKDIPYYPYYLGVSIEACPLVHREGYEAGQLALGDYVTTLVRTGGAMCITSACEDIETAMTLLDWAYSDAGAEVCNYGWTEGETYTVENGQKYITTFMQEQSDYGFGNKTFYSADQDFGLIYPNVEFDVADEATKAVCEGWDVDESNAAAIYLHLPGAARLTADEAAEVATLEADLATYVDSTLMRWMSGVDELSDETWNEFVSTCNSMQLDVIQFAYQSAFNRYLDT